VILASFHDLQSCKPKLISENHSFSKRISSILKNLFIFFVDLCGFISNSQIILSFIYFILFSSENIFLPFKYSQIAFDALKTIGPLIQ